MLVWGLTDSYGLAATSNYDHSQPKFYIVKLPLDFCDDGLFEQRLYCSFWEQ
jgi:hypothetical protein